MVILGLPALLAVLLACPPWATMLLVCVIAGVAAYELLHTAAPQAPVFVCGMTVAAAVLQTVYGYTGSTALAVGAADAVTTVRWVFLMLLFLTAVVSHERGGTFTFPQLAAAVVGGIVFPALYGCLYRLRCAGEFGRLYVLAPFAVAFLGDTFSMYAGILFGKAKMAPRVSPHKTWAGFWCGPLGSAIGMLLVGLLGVRWLGYAPVYWKLAAVGAFANLFGQLGDLSMSLIKREAGIKDYSRLFLEHGGMLDRFDSTMFILPVIWAFVSSGAI